jgi:predicted site-specific integrase-resolvase
MLTRSPDRAPRVYCIKNAALKLDVCRRTIERLIKSEKIRTVQITERRRGIPAEEIERIAAYGIVR